MTLRRDCLRPCTGIWSRPVNEDDLLKWESLVIGPALSPYAFGFFTFRMQVLAPSSIPHPSLPLPTLARSPASSCVRSSASMPTFMLG